VEVARGATVRVAAAIKQASRQVSNKMHSTVTQEDALYCRALLVKPHVRSAAELVRVVAESRAVSAAIA
jgi:hypothetical protein